MTFYIQGKHIQEEYIEVNSIRFVIRVINLFHMYYTVRRVLAELKVALPGDQSFDALDSPYDHRAYQRLADEFEVDRRADWRVKEGLGVVHLKGVCRSWTQRGGGGGHFRPQEHVETWTAPVFDPRTIEVEKELGRNSSVFDSHIQATKSQIQPFFLKGLNFS